MIKKASCYPFCSITDEEKKNYGISEERKVVILSWCFWVPPSAPLRTYSHAPLHWCLSDPSLVFKKLMDSFLSFPLSPPKINDFLPLFRLWLVYCKILWVPKQLGNTRLNGCRIRAMKNEAKPFSYLPPCIGVICPWGVDAGVGGFKSPGTSVMELLPVDCGVCGPCKEPELAGKKKKSNYEKGAAKFLWK